MSCHLTINGVPECQAGLRAHFRVAGVTEVPTRCGYGERWQEADSDVAAVKAVLPDLDIQVMAGHCHENPWWKSPNGVIAADQEQQWDECLDRSYDEAQVQRIAVLEVRQSEMLAALFRMYVLTGADTDGMSDFGALMHPLPEVLVEDSVRQMRADYDMACDRIEGMAEAIERFLPAEDRFYDGATAAVKVNYETTLHNLKSVVRNTPSGEKDALAALKAAQEERDELVKALELVTGGMTEAEIDEAEERGLDVHFGGGLMKQIAAVLAKANNPNPEVKR